MERGERRKWEGNRKRKREIERKGKGKGKNEQNGKYFQDDKE